MTDSNDTNTRSIVHSQRNSLPGYAEDNTIEDESGKPDGLGHFMNMVIASGVFLLVSVPVIEYTFIETIEHLFVVFTFSLALLAVIVFGIDEAYQHM